MTFAGRLTISIFILTAFSHSRIEEAVIFMIFVTIAQSYGKSVQVLLPARVLPRLTVRQDCGFGGNEVGEMRGF